VDRISLARLVSKALEEVLFEGFIVEFDGGFFAVWLLEFHRGFFGGFSG
jgi:hypothetical protein